MSADAATDETADDVMLDSFNRLSRLAQGADKTKTLQYLVFMVSCPVGAFVRRCLAALVDLTADENCRAQLVAEGLVPSLVALCSRSRDNTLLACAAGCLGNLALDGASATQQALLGAVSPLVTLCTSSQDSVVLANALKGASALAAHAVARAPLAQAGLIPAIVKICTRSQDEALRQYSVRALSWLSQGADGAAGLVGDGALPLLVRLCAESDDAVVLECGACCLRNLARVDSLRALVVDERGLDALARLCDNLFDAAVVGAATEALALLAQNKGCRSRLQASVAPMVALLVVARDERVLGNLAGALATLARHKTNKLSIMDAGGAAALGELMARAGGNVSVMGNAAQAVATLARQEAFRPRLVQAGLVAQLASALQVAQSSRAAAAAGGTQQLQEEATAENAASATADARVLRYASDALGALALDAAGRAQLVEDGVAVPALLASIGLCTSTVGARAQPPTPPGDAVAAPSGRITATHGMTAEQQGHVLLGCATAIANVAADATLCTALVTGGVVPPLVGLCAGGDAAGAAEHDVLRARAVEACHNLAVAADSGSHGSLIESGAVEHLVLLCREQEERTALAAAGSDGAAATGTASKAQLGGQEMPPSADAEAVVSVMAHSAALLLALSRGEHAVAAGALKQGACAALAMLVARRSSSAPQPQTQEQQERQLAADAREALLHFCCHSGQQARPTPVQEAAVRPLVELCALCRPTAVGPEAAPSPAPTEATAAAPNVALRREAVAVLLKLGLDDEAAPSAVLRLCSFTKHDAALALATASLVALAGCANARPALTQHGVVELGVRLCREGTGAAVLRNAAQLLARVLAADDDAERADAEASGAAVDEGRCAHAVQVEAAEPLVLLYERAQDVAAGGSGSVAAPGDDASAVSAGDAAATADAAAAVVLHTTRALHRLCGAADCRPRVIAAGALPPLLRLCSVETAGADDAESGGTVDIAARTIAKLCAHAESRPIIFAQGGALALVAMCRRATGPLLLATAVEAVQCLSCVDAARPQLVEQAVVPLLVRASELPPTADALRCRGLAADTLRELSKDEVSRKRIVAEGAVKLLAQLCDTREGSVCARAIAAAKALPGAGSGGGDKAIVDSSTLTMLQLARSRDPTTRMRMVADGATEPLVNLCATTRLGDGELLAHAAGAIANLASDASSRAEIVNQGPIRPLVRICGSCQDRKAICNATAAMRNLARHDDPTRAAIVEAGAVPALARLCDLSLAECEPATLSFAVGVVVNLTLHEGSRSQIVRDGATLPLVRLCAGAKDMAVVSFATQALVNLACHEGNRAQLVREGAVRPLMQLCESPNEAAVLGNAAAALANLARFEGNRAMIVQQGAVRSLVTLCGTSQEPNVLGNAAGVLATLALDAPSRPRMLHDGAARALVALCAKLSAEISDPRALGNAAEGLANLALFEAGEPKLVQNGVAWCGGVAVLVKLLNDTRDNRVAGYAAKALATVAANDSNRAQIVQEGGLVPLLAVCGSSRNNAVLQNATEALVNLSQHAPNRRAMVLASTTPPLVKLCTEAADARVLAHAAEVIRNLARDEGSRMRIVEEGAVGPLVRLISMSQDAAVLSNCAAALANLALNGDTRRRMALEGAVRPLVQLCSIATDVTVLASVAVAMRHLALDEGLRPKLVLAGAVKPLIALLSCEEGSVRGHAAAALRNIARHDESRIRIVLEGGVAPLVALCAQGQDPQVRALLLHSRDRCICMSLPLLLTTSFSFCSARAETQVLGNSLLALATLALDEGSRPQLVSQGVCQCLVSLCGTLKDNVLNSYAAGALANLAIYEDGRSTMVQEGAISPLVQFCLRSGDNTVIGYAALALARLAVTERASLGNVVGGGNAFYALIRAQQTLGQEIAPYLMQPIADAIIALTPKPADA